MKIISRRSNHVNRNETRRAPTIPPNDMILDYGKRYNYLDTVGGFSTPIIPIPPTFPPALAPLAFPTACGGVGGVRGAGG